MACGAVRWSPYVECLVIIDWALEVWDDIEGKLLSNGVDPDDLNVEQMMRVLYSAMVDDVVSMEVSRAEAREAVDKEIANMVMRTEARRLASQRTTSKTPEDIGIAQPVRLTSDLAYTIGLKPPKSGGST